MKYLLLSMFKQLFVWQNNIFCLHKISTNIFLLMNMEFSNNSSTPHSGFLSYIHCLHQINIASHPENSAHFRRQTMNVFKEESRIMDPVSIHCCLKPILYFCSFVRFLYFCIFVFLYFCIFVFLYFCIFCIFVCICVFVYKEAWVRLKWQKMLPCFL